MIIRVLPALALLPLLVGGCSGDDEASSSPTPPAASAPAPGVTLPPDDLASLVPAPGEVPAGMVLVTKGSGPRDVAVVASYNGTGAAATTARAKLTQHGFQKAYVAQYVDPTSGAVLSVLASRFATVGGATADFADDERARSGTAVTVEPVGDESSATTTAVPGSVPAQLLLLRFRKGATTWSLAFRAAPTADAAVATALAKTVVGRA